MHTHLHVFSTYLFAISLTHSPILTYITYYVHIFSNETYYGIRWNFTTTASGALVHDPCVEEWQGVTVAVAVAVAVDYSQSVTEECTCRVTGLFLNKRGLAGPLPPTLGNLNATTVRYMHTYIHTYKHTCIHTYIHTYIHTCMLLLLLMYAVAVTTSIV